MPDYKHATPTNERLLAHETSGRRDCVGGGAAGARVVGLVATTLVLEIASAGGTVAGAFRHQHGKAACDQPAGQRTVFRLRHLRTTQHVLRGGMRNHRQRKRPVAGRTKQQGVRRGIDRR